MGEYDCVQITFYVWTTTSMFISLGYGPEQVNWY